MREDGAATKPGGTGLLTAGLVLAGVIAAGLYMSFGSENAPSEEELAVVVAQEPATPSTVDPTSEPVEEATPRPEEQPEVVEDSEAVDIAPSIDEVRLEDDGLTVIAGRAAPGAAVTVLVDGAEVARATADARGAFATVVLVAPSSAARVLTLQSDHEGGTVGSAEDVILAPLQASKSKTEEVASSETGSATETQPQINQGEPASTDPDEGEPESKDPEVAADVENPRSPVKTPDPSETDTVAALTPEAIAPAPQPEAQATQEPVEATTNETQSQGAPTATTAEKDPEITTTPGAATQKTPETDTTTEGVGTQSVAVLKSTAEGVELLQSDAAPAVDVDIDTIGYSDLGDVQLSGRAVPGSFEIRVYLDNRFVASLPVETEGGWRGTVPDVDEGIYTLRVDQVNTAGDVTSRLETPFKREAPAVLAEASEDQDGPVRAITVQTGDTLWAIARERYGEGFLYVRVFEANVESIRDPDLIYPGQVFDLPVE